MGMVGLADNIIGLIEESMNKWKINLYADRKLLGSVPIRRGIFQGDSFSPLLFVIALLPLIHILRETGMGYQLEKNEAKEGERRISEKNNTAHLNRKNLFLALKTWAKSVMRYKCCFLGLDERRDKRTWLLD